MTTAAVGNRSGPAGRRASRSESGEHDERAGRIRLQGGAQVAVHGRLDARRHPAERARDAGERPERAGKPGVSGSSGRTAAAPSMATAAPRASVRSIVVEAAVTSHAARCYSAERLAATPFGGQQALEEHLVAARPAMRRRPSGAGGPRALRRSGSARPRRGRPGARGTPRPCRGPAGRRRSCPRRRLHQVRRAAPRRRQTRAARGRRACRRRGRRAAGSVA